MPRRPTPQPVEFSGADEHPSPPDPEKRVEIVSIPVRAGMLGTDWAIQMNAGTDSERTVAFTGVTDTPREDVTEVSQRLCSLAYLMGLADGVRSLGHAAELGVAGGITILAEPGGMIAVRNGVTAEWYEGWQEVWEAVNRIAGVGGGVLPIVTERG